MPKLALAIVLGFLSLSLAALPLIPEDSPLLTRADLIFDIQPAKGEYRLVLGAIKKANNRWRSENELTVVGSGSRRTYELRSVLTYAEAQKLLSQELDQIKGKKLLFHCQGRDCGSSNGWANEFFQVKQLYGLDDYQEYWVWSLPNSERNNVYAVLYLVQRGNKRIYLQEDVIVTEAPKQDLALLGPRDVKRALDQNGYFTVPGLQIEKGQLKIPAATMNVLVDMLQAHPLMSVRLVGHNYQAGSLHEQTQRSARHSQDLFDLLVEKGIEKNRLSVHGVGGLAPAGKQGPVRVDLVATR